VNAGSHRVMNGVAVRIEEPALGVEQRAVDVDAYEPDRHERGTIIRVNIERL
jgi:hypothetical protein